VSTRCTIADPHLAERQREFLGERSVQVLVHLGDRGVEAEPGLDADGEKIERVRELGAEVLFAVTRLVGEEDVRKHEGPRPEGESEEHALRRRSGRDQGEQEASQG
jgi:hypothetical protein